MLADNLMYIGSANFSDATLSNVELGVVLKLSCTAAAEELAHLNGMWLNAVVD